MSERKKKKLTEAEIRKRCDRRMTDAERREQRISFAYGNTVIENPNITRELVEQLGDEPPDRQIIEE